MFSNASTFKVELDEWYVLCFDTAIWSLADLSNLFSCKILRNATPRSLVILDGEFAVCRIVIIFDAVNRTRPWNFHLCESHSIPQHLQSLIPVIIRTEWLLQGFVSILLSQPRNDSPDSHRQAVLHQLATHTLPLCFFATHYGSLTDDYSYHPNIRSMHMSTMVDDEKCEVRPS